MTTDELRALLLECHKILSLMGRTLESSPNLIGVRCSYCGGVVRHFEKCDLKENISKIDAALASDFAVVPREPTMQIEAAYFLALDHYGTKNHYPVYKAILAAAEGK